MCTWCRSAGRTCRRKLRARRPLLPPPYKSLASKAPVAAPTRHRPRRPVGLRRLAHRALRSAPARSPLSRSPRSRPVVQTVHWLASHAVSTRGVEQPPHPSHRAPRHACPLAPHVRASPHSAPSALALTALSPRCSDCAPPAAHPLQAHETPRDRADAIAWLSPRATRRPLNTRSSSCTSRTSTQRP